MEKAQLRTYIRLLVSLLLGTLFALHLSFPSRKSAINSLNSSHNQYSILQSGSLSVHRKQALYNSDLNHIWNRLHRALFVRVSREGREYGYDELDPLLWSETKHLLSGPSNQKAIDLLDEFLSTNAERLITDPLKRAILQRDLWAIFDWSTQRANEHSPQKRQLQIRLAQVIRRLALSKDQIQKLPNSYDDAIASKRFSTIYDPDQRDMPFLPQDLFRPDGSWVSLNANDARPVASEHVSGFSGRSVFLVFMRLPAGRQAALDYLAKMQDFPRPWIQNPRDTGRYLPNPELPQFPVGTQLALVRKMILIDDQSNLTPAELIEQVQIRVHRAIPSTIPEGVNLDSNEAMTSIDVFEFKLSREKLFQGETGGLRAVTRDDREFAVFQTHGWDHFEMSSDHGTVERFLGSPLRSCALCHFRPGIHSVLSRRDTVLSWRRDKLIASWGPKHEENATIEWKHSRYDWGLLTGLWELQRGPQR